MYTDLELEKIGYQVAGIGRNLSFKDDNLYFSFDYFLPDDNMPQTGSCYISFYEGEFKINISGREGFPLEEKYAKKYCSIFNSTLFGKKISEIINEPYLTFDYNYGVGYQSFVKKIKEKTVKELYKYLKNIHEDN